MSEIFEPATIPQPVVPENKFAIPVRYGLMVGFISMFLTTVTFLYVLKWSYVAFLVTLFFMFIIPIVFYWIALTKQKREFGGSILLKDAFQAVFIVILIATLISTIYGLIYNKYIDPYAAERLKEQSIVFFEKVKMPEDQMNEKIQEMDARIESSTKPSVLIYSVAQQILVSSIFGFIISLIVSRKKPVVQP
jgi:signal transduction histidine kinase